MTDHLTYPWMKHLYLSHSSRRTLHSCNRKFEIAKFFKHPRRDSGLAAEMGKALHAGLQDFLVHKDEDKAIFEYMKAYPIDLCQSTMDKYSLEAGYNTLQAMINSTPLLDYQLAKVNCLDGVTRNAIEVPFEINLEGYKLSDRLPITVSYCGFIDAIFYQMSEDEFIVIDIKTTQRVDTDLSPKFAKSEQCIPYALVLQYMTGKEIKGFTVKYVVAQIDIETANCQIHSFEKSETDVTDWFKGLLVDLENIRMFVEMEWFPRSGGGDGCMAYKKKCHYFDVCDVRETKALQMIIEQESNGVDAMPEVDFWENKGLQNTFNPWVKFGIPVPEMR